MKVPRGHREALEAEATRLFRDLHTIMWKVEVCGFGAEGKKWVDEESWPGTFELFSFLAEWNTILINTERTATDFQI